MKPYVICHMMPSVDGRLRTQRWDVSKASHAEYERTAATYRADGWICGRRTMEEFAKGRAKASRKRTPKIPREDFVIPRERGKRLAIAIDRHGKLLWSDNEIEGDALAVVLAEDVPDGYLAFLREKGIAYLFAGKTADEPVDLRLMLDKLARKFGVRKLMLEGGGETNGAFLRQGLIDELSMLLTPVVDGRPGEPALFDLAGSNAKKAIAHLRLKSVRRAASDMLWIRYSVQSRRARG